MSATVHDVTGDDGSPRPAPCLPPNLPPPHKNAIQLTGIVIQTGAVQAIPPKGTAYCELEIRVHAQRFTIVGRDAVAEKMASAGERFTIDVRGSLVIERWDAGGAERQRTVIDAVSIDFLHEPRK